MHSSHRELRRRVIPLEIRRASRARRQSRERDVSLTGLTLLDTVIGIGILAIVLLSVMGAYGNIVSTLTSTNLRTAALSVAESEIETVRNMAYADVGVQGGFPNGKLLAGRNVMVGNVTFLIRTTVRNIDDPFDGTIGGTVRVSRRCVVDLCCRCGR